MPLNESPPKYQVQITQRGRYDWTALIADMTTEPARATTLHANSIDALMAKCLISVVLHDKDAEDRANAPRAEKPEAPPIILMPNNRIVPPSALG